MSIRTRPGSRPGGCRSCEPPRARGQPQARQERQCRRARRGFACGALPAANTTMHAGERVPGFATSSPCGLPRRVVEPSLLRARPSARATIVEPGYRSGRVGAMPTRRVTSPAAGAARASPLRHRNAFSEGLGSSVRSSGRRHSAGRPRASSRRLANRGSGARRTGLTHCPLAFASLDRPPGERAGGVDRRSVGARGWSHPPDRHRDARRQDVATLQSRAMALRPAAATICRRHTASRRIGDPRGRSPNALVQEPASHLARTAPGARIPNDSPSAGPVAPRIAGASLRPPPRRPLRLRVEVTARRCQAASDTRGRRPPRDMDRWRCAARGWRAQTHPARAPSERAPATARHRRFGNSAHRPLPRRSAPARRSEGTQRRPHQHRHLEALPPQLGRIRSVSGEAHSP